MTECIRAAVQAAAEAVCSSRGFLLQPRLFVTAEAFCYSRGFLLQSIFSSQADSRQASKIRLKPTGNRLESKIILETKVEPNTNLQRFSDGETTRAKWWDRLHSSLERIKAKYE